MFPILVGIPQADPEARIHMKASVKEVSVVTTGRAVGKWDLQEEKAKPGCFICASIIVLLEGFLLFFLFLPDSGVTPSLQIFGPNT